jgi:prepilin-type N-terminal cleavage/methylation domain-containing protein/prepilin-type processing-associated H-X9-DG protein
MRVSEIGCQSSAVRLIFLGRAARFTFDVGGAAGSRKICRSGLTLIELLIVMGIIGALVAMLLPAVQSAREAARRTACQNNLRQIGVALHAYHGAAGSLPPAVIWFPAGEPLGGGQVPIGVIDRVALQGALDDDRIFANWAIALLPQLEQAAVYGRFNALRPLSDPSNAAVRGTWLAVMRCPSDGYSDESNPYRRGLAAGLTDNLYARGNYAINVGPDANCVEPGTEQQPCRNGFFVDSTDLVRRNSQVWGTGIAGANKTFKFQDVTDGLSQTVALDEIRAGLNAVDPRGVWSLGQVGASVLVRHGRFSNSAGPNACDDKTDQFIGCSALKKQMGLAFVLGECMDCDEAFAINAKSAARSLHPHGVNILLCDGAVRFAANGMDLQTWHALHTRNQGERFEY